MGAEFDNKFENKEGIWSFSKSIFDAAKGADAIVILSEWEQFRTIDWDKVSSLMRSPSWLFDTRIISNIEEAISSGLNVWKIGYGAITSVTNKDISD